MSSMRSASSRMRTSSWEITGVGAATMIEQAAGGGDEESTPVRRRGPEGRADAAEDHGARDRGVNGHLGEMVLIWGRISRVGVRTRTRVPRVGRVMRW